MKPFFCDLPFLSVRKFPSLPTHTIAMSHQTFLLSFLLLISCGAPSTESSDIDMEVMLSPEEMTQDSLYKAVMVIHDEAMPKMDYMYQLRNQLTEAADSLQDLSNPPVLADSLRAVALKVEVAEEAMMNWMRSNDFKFEQMAHKEIIKELEKEKTAIIVVKEQMLNSIEKAEQVLAKLDEK